jgi:hypothetical protein
MSQEKLESAKNLFFVALGIDMAVTVLVVITDLWAVGVLNDIRSGVNSADQSTISTLEFWESFAKVMILTLIGVGLTLVRWLDACYEYAKETLKATGFAQEGWKTWGWIVPFMNVFKPYQVLSEIYKAGAADYLGSEDWKKSSGSGTLLLWWVFWVVTHMIMWGIGKQALKGAFRDDLTLNQIIGMYYGSVAVCVISLIVAGLWYVVAGILTRRLLDRPRVAPSKATAEKFGYQVSAVTSMPAGTSSQSSASYSPSLPVPSLGAALTMPKSAFTTQPAQPATREIPELENIEDRIYAQVGEELESGNTDKGIWTKAFAQAGGDDKQTRVLYIKLRVEKLIAAERGRVELLKQALEEAEQLRVAEAERLDRMGWKEKVAAGLIDPQIAVQKSGGKAEIFLTKCGSGDINEIERMINEYPILVAVANVAGNTPLHYAVRSRNLPLVKLLFDEGANLSARNLAGQRPFDLAVQLGMECPTEYPAYKSIADFLYR